MQEEEIKKRKEWVETETGRECEDCKKEWVLHECKEDLYLNENIGIPRMRGGAGGAYRYGRDMVDKAIASAWRQNKIELEHGRPTIETWATFSW